MEDKMIKDSCVKLVGTPIHFRIKTDSIAEHLHA